MKRPAAAAAEVPSKRPAAVKEDGETWDCTSNPHIMLGGCGHIATDIMKHVAKIVPRKKGDDGLTLKACVGCYQCVVLSHQNLCADGDEFVVTVKLAAAQKKFACMVGILAEEAGLGSYGASSRWFCLAAGRGPLSLQNNYPGAEFGSMLAADFPEVGIGDKLQMSIRVDGAEDKLSYSVNGVAVVHPTIVATFADLRKKAMEGRSSDSTWKGWRPFIALTNATVVVLDEN
mmetsp:Transcript_17628/g.31870  ORF Transcript_17628/g.31870 Transcript_17628/m.31870 type:complete len:231 (-) Transcript_17628:215-907(-)